MAKTFLVGEGAVRLVPNAAGFHIKARKELAADKLSVGVDLKPDVTGFTKQAKARLDTVKLSTKVNLKPDVTGFHQEAQGKIDAGRKLSLKVKIEGEIDRGSIAKAHQEAQAQLRAMGPLKVEIKADVDMASLRRALDILKAKVESTRITANINSRNGRMSGLPGGGSGSGGGVGVGRTMRNAAIGTGVTLAPIVTKAAVGGLTALVGAASQATGALGLLPAAATAAGAGLAAVAIGAAGIGGAFSALSKESASAGSAVSQSASQQASAQRSIEQADRGLATAHRGVARALEDLNDVRKDAVRRLRDMNDELKMAPINEREAALAIKEATKRLQEAYASGDSLEIEGAQIDLDKSKLQYDQLRKQNDDLASDVAEANKKGVEGDKQVIAAKDGVVDAVNGVKDAQDALASAMESAAEASKSMAGGVDQLAQAMAKLSPNAQDFVRKIQALGPAWTETRKFIQDRLFDGLGDSVTTLATRQLPVLKAGLGGIAEELNGGVKEAMAVFSGDGAVRDFAATLGNVRQMWAGIADSFAPFAQGFIDVTTVGSTFMPRLGTAVRDMAYSFQESMAQWRADGTMQQFFENSMTMAKQLGRILGNVGAIIGQVFSAGAEVGGGFLNTIETATADLREFLGSADGQDGLKTFFEGVKAAVQTLAPIIQIVASTLLTVLGPALTDLVTGLGPGLVAMFEGLSQGLSAIQPVMSVVGEALGGLGRELGEVFKVLGPVIAESLAALAPAVTPLAQLLGSIIKGLAPILTLVTEVVGALVTALAPAFQKITDALGPVIQELVDALMPVIPPLAEAIGQMAGALGGVLASVIGALAPVIPQIAQGFANLVISLLPLVPVLAELITNLLPGLMTVLNAILPIIPLIVDLLVEVVNFIVPILIPVLNTLSTVVTTVFTGIANIIGWAIRDVIMPVLTLLAGLITDTGDIFSWLWNEAIKPAWDGITTAVKWGWENLIKPTFESLKIGISAVGSFFSAVVDGIKTTWDRLTNIAATPINWVINHVINGGIGKAWKAVDNFLGGHLPDWVDVSPIAMASGGEVPMAKGAERGKDSVRILGMPGEHMWDVQDVVSAGGQQAMYQMRDMVGKGIPFTWTPKGLVAGPGMGDGAALPRFKDGGELSAGEKLSAGPGEGGLQPIAQLFSRIIKATWPNGVTSIGGYRPPDGYNEHSTGRALDVMLRDVGGQAGDEIKDFSIANNAKYPINWTIWKQAMWYPPDGRRDPMGDRGSPTQNHFDHDHIFYKEKSVNPNVVPDDIVYGGVTDAAVRKGITAWAERAFNTALLPVKKSLESSAFNPPPYIKEVPRYVYDGMVKPAKEKLLDEVSKLTSIDGWKDILGGAVGKVKDAAKNSVGGVINWGKRILFDTGGKVGQGTTVVQNNTGQDEYLIKPLDYLLLRGLIGALRAIGINPKIDQSGQKPDANTPTPAPRTTEEINKSAEPEKEQKVPEKEQKVPESDDLPIPENVEIKPPTQQDLDDSTGGAIALRKNPDGTYSAVDPEWNKLIQRESGGRADVVQGISDANSGGNEASGLFQIAKSTWAGYGGTKYAPTAGQATAEQQAEIAAAIFNKEGGSPWGSGKGQNFGRENEDALRAGLRKPAPAGTKDDPVNVTTTNWPTTANNVKPGDTVGSSNGQNLQGAAIGKDGSYKPDNNVTLTLSTPSTPSTLSTLSTPSTPSTDKGGLAAQSPTFTNPFETDAGKLAQGFAKKTPLGIGGPQMETISKKAPALVDLAGGIAKAAPAWGAALASGDPAALGAIVAEATGTWATKTALDFATYIPEAAPGMLESLLSGVAGPLVGTIHTGASTDQVMSTMQDLQNRQARRTKMGRGRG